MKTVSRGVVAAIALSLSLSAAPAAFASMDEKTVEVGGAAMYPSKTIVENASAAANLTTLVAAVKAAGLVETLSSEGPFTVFAPTNDAFAKLPAGTVDTLLRPENKGQLTSVLTYHVVPGKLSAMQLRQRVQAGKGRAVLRTAQGENLTVTQMGRRLVVTDAHGGRSMISIADVNQSNGLIHVVDTVLMP